MLKGRVIFFVYDTLVPDSMLGKIYLEQSHIIFC
ncbi:hypothetical protein E9M_00691 [Moraxella catarrhalis 46P47B1]|nr:hypothetical protein E9G_09450 [Moraxella catarrhalis 7169]EGE14530.1 hypothetical protein E9K_04632 [Moraxella catarrhalis 103P14B1]EGE14930.1 hypothetical protein E9M_00691 [Moraxella catarrhalis 46P47B1]EGE17354.1 hypothetical protein E9O_00959 [Moraxella catarrhalis 12P80B1]EGE18343.1 hypothetical protein E9U_09495 [Moraxella catarrhalis BC8]EGE20008.1 hypothetical protein E9Q_01401 [Moraxella catarrhalis BC1]EGE20089.1 hypothetical protein E9S_06368 [Moraxella catarrhalis BC7]EGE2288